MALLVSSNQGAENAVLLSIEKAQLLTVSGLEGYLYALDVILRNGDERPKKCTFTVWKLSQTTPAIEGIELRCERGPSITLW